MLLLMGKHLCLLIRIYAPTTRACGITAKNCGMKNFYILTSLSMAMSSTLREGGEPYTVTHKNNLKKKFGCFGIYNQWQCYVVDKSKQYVTVFFYFVVEV